MKGRRSRVLKIMVCKRCRGWGWRLPGSLADGVSLVVSAAEEGGNLLSRHIRASSNIQRFCWYANMDFMFTRAYSAIAACPSWQRHRSVRAIRQGIPTYPSYQCWGKKVSDPFPIFYIFVTFLIFDKYKHKIVFLTTSWPGHLLDPPPFLNRHISVFS